MSTDFRALCAELHAAFNTYAVDQSHHALLERARAALAEPQPKAPTIMEIIELADEIEAAELGQVDMVRTALARWGTAAPQPIPVSERLPEAGDCDAEGMCWLCGKVNGDWRLLNPNNSGLPQLKYCFSHWLPAHALPLPTIRETH